MDTLLLTVEIKEKNIGGWYLTLTNTITEKSFDVETMEELNEKMETFASLYPEAQPQVDWIENGEVRDEYVNEVRQQILAFSEETA